MLEAMRRERHQSQKTSSNIFRTRRWLLSTQNALTLLTERLNTIHCLGWPLKTQGKVDEDGVLPVPSLQQLCADLMGRFGRLVELQVRHSHSSPRTHSGLGFARNSHLVNAHGWAVPRHTQQRV